MTKKEYRDILHEILTFVSAGRMTVDEAMKKLEHPLISTCDEEVRNSVHAPRNGWG